MHKWGEVIMDDEINPEILIALVEERNVLWDRTSEYYKKKQYILSAWRDICCILNPSFKQLSDKDKKEFGKLVSYKWSNIRDACLRATKKEEYAKRAGVKAARPYIYKQQMQFLLNTFELKSTNRSARKQSTTQSTLNVCMSEEDRIQPKTETPTESKKLKSGDVKEILSQFFDSKIAEENPQLSFFKGILPALKSFDDDETLEFQSGVLSLIQTIRKKRNKK